MFMHHVSDSDQYRLRCLADGLASGNPQQRVAVVTGISQELLFALCKLFHSTRRPLLYAVSGFHFPNCLSCLSSPEATTRAPQVSRGSVSAASTRTPRGDPNVELVGCMAEIMENSDQEPGPPHVLLSVNSIGVVSEKADCILLKT